MQSAVAVFAVMIGLGLGAADAVHVISSSTHLFGNFLDQLFFLILSISLYSVVGLLAGLVASLVSPALFPAVKGSQESSLPGFYLSVFIGATCGFVLAVEQISFTTMLQSLWRNLGVLLVIALSTYFLMFLLMKLLCRLVFLSNLLDRIKPVLFNKFAAVLLGACLVGSFYQVTGLAGYKSDNADRPNIILISFDTLGANHVGAYGYGKPTTPNLDQFAAEAALFENHFSVSRITLPSHMTMFTSVYPSVHQVTDSFASVLDDEFKTLAELLAESGYETGALVDGDRELNIGAAHGFDQGFDFYEHYPDRFVKHEKLYVVKRLFNFLENFLHRRGVADMHSDKIFGGALSWIGARESSRPFFLFLHTYDIHGDFGTRLPYVAPAEYSELIKSDYAGDFNGCGKSGECATSYLVEINKRIRRGSDPKAFLSAEDAAYIATLYDRGIRYTDDEFGKFFDGLKRMNVHDNTIIMLTSDHGEEFYQHNQLKHVQYYDEVLKVPLLIRYPPKISAGTKIPGLSRSVDLAPTLLHLAGLEHNLSQFQGVSLLPRITGANVSELALFAGQDHPSMDAETKIVRTMDYKYIKNGSDRMHYRFNENRPEELYEIKTDPAETENVVTSRKDVHAEMVRLLDQWTEACLQLRGKMVPVGLTKKLSIDKKSAEALKSLGYVK